MKTEEFVAIAEEIRRRLQWVYDKLGELQARHEIAAAMPMAA